MSPIKRLKVLLERSAKVPWLGKTFLFKRKSDQSEHRAEDSSCADAGCSHSANESIVTDAMADQNVEALSRFAASIGHEISNPLTILSMNISRIILQYRKDRNIRVKDILEYFERMENNISRIKAVVNTLTHLLRKTEHSKMRPLNLRKLVDETIPLCQFQTYLDHFSHVDVKNDIPDNLPLIKGDAERLQEVFLNLFVNAYRAVLGKKNGFIWVGAALSAKDPNKIIIELTDNGCGMDSETVKKVFQYGFTTKVQAKGSGIGLYLSRYIITLHGGDIRVRSRKGEGTFFTITLPIYKYTRKAFVMPHVVNVGAV